MINVLYVRIVMCFRIRVIGFVTLSKASLPNPLSPCVSLQYEYNNECHMKSSCTRLERPVPNQWMSTTYAINTSDCVFLLTDLRSLFLLISRGKQIFENHSSSIIRISRRNINASPSLRRGKSTDVMFTEHFTISLFYHTGTSRNTVFSRFSREARGSNHLSSVARPRGSLGV